MERLLHLENNKRSFLAELNKIKTHKRVKKVQMKQQYKATRCLQEKELMKLSLPLFQCLSNTIMKKWNQSFIIIKNRAKSIQQKPLQPQQKQGILEKNHQKIGLFLLRKITQDKIQKYQEQFIYKIQSFNAESKVLLKSFKIIQKWMVRMPFKRLKNQQKYTLSKLDISKISYQGKGEAYNSEKLVNEINEKQKQKLENQLQRLKDEFKKLKGKEQSQIRNLKEKMQNEVTFEEQSCSQFFQDTNQILLGKYMRLTYDLQGKLETVRSILKGVNCGENKAMRYFFDSMAKISKIYEEVD